jgi:glyoxylase-like metal-dependent hydrolase (beta-lactamase superfamily II)
VHTYRSGETGLFVNSYLVEGANGVVAIDARLLLSDGRAFRARFVGVLVTHPHPDHYNTITDLVAGEEVPVIAHHDVDREIRASGRLQARPVGSDVRGRVAGERDLPEPHRG